jgi:hypothetical protein
MSYKFATGRQSFVGRGISQPTPISLDAAVYAGTIVFGDDGVFYKSDGIEWTEIASGSGDVGFTGSKGDQATNIVFKGSVEEVVDLPPSGNTTNDAYIVLADGNLYVWNGTQWENAGPIVGPTGFTGSRGDTGSVGFTGSKGDIGFTGSRGIQGSSGDSGSIGFTGSRGSIGFTGSVGAQGFTGSVGFVGSRGFIGFTGSRGDVGEGGGLGFTGSQGVIGFTGSLGPVGFTGSRGSTGFTGSTGFSGSFGFTGSRGFTGFTGSNGIDGGTLVVSDVSTNDTRYVMFTDETDGEVFQVGVALNKLYFNPLTGTLNATEFNSLSDLTMKENVQPISESIIDVLNPVSFTWKETGSKSYGLIAQELEEVLPELVREANGVKSVSYIPLISILIEEVKRLRNEVKEIKKVRD